MMALLKIMNDVTIKVDEELSNLLLLFLVLIFPFHNITTAQAINVKFGLGQSQGHDNLYIKLDVAPTQNC